MSDPAQKSILDLSAYVRILRQRWRWALAAFATVLGAAILFPLFQGDSFTAQTRVLIGQTQAESVVTNQSQNSSLLTRSLANETSLIESDSVRTRVEKLLDVETARHRQVQCRPGTTWSRTNRHTPDTSRLAV